LVNILTLAFFLQVFELLRIFIGVKYCGRALRVPFTLVVEREVAALPSLGLTRFELVVGACQVGIHQSGLSRILKVALDSILTVIVVNKAEDGTLVSSPALALSTCIYISVTCASFFGNLGFRGRQYEK